jgi:hypothetical protein
MTFGNDEYKAYEHDQIEKSWEVVLVIDGQNVGLPDSDPYEGMVSLRVFPGSDEAEAFIDGLRHGENPCSCISFLRMPRNAFKEAMALFFRFHFEASRPVNGEAECYEIRLKDRESMLIDVTSINILNQALESHVK